MTYTVYELDVWGNIDDGYAVNQWWRTPRQITIDNDTTHQKIIEKLEEWYEFSEGVEVEDWQENVIYINAANGMPLLTLNKE